MNLQENILRIKEVMGLLNEQQTTTTSYVLPQGHVEPTCTDAGCKGEYKGPQFLKSDSSDVAHKYSNTMSNYVGIKLKELYNRGIYVKVDLKNIVMTADPVQYGENYNQTHVTIDIPFIRVKNKCDAYTSFDHVGGWGHTHKINLSGRKSKLSSLLLPGETLDVSDLKMTHKNVNESLNEYWIQWKNITTQSDCANNSPSNGQQVTVTGNSYIDLRNKIINQSSNSSIDVNSIKVNMDKFEITYNLGQTKINKISLYTRNTDIKDNTEFTTALNSVIAKNKSDGLTIKVIKEGSQDNVTVSNDKDTWKTTVYWAVLLIT
jgi:hypothetical protein